MAAGSAADSTGRKRGRSPDIEWESEHKRQFQYQRKGEWANYSETDNAALNIHYDTFLLDTSEQVFQFSGDRSVDFRWFLQTSCKKSPTGYRRRIRFIYS